MVQIWENFPSRGVTDSDKPTTEYSYTVTGTDNQVLVLALVNATAPTTDGDLWRQEVRIRETAPGVWEGTVTYGPRKKPEPGDFAINLDFSGQNKHITQALEHIEDYPDGTAPDHKGAIGVDENGHCAGCDIVVPQFAWSEQWQLDAAEVDWDYLNGLSELVGKLNDDTFRGFAALRVLLQGATGSLSAKNPAVWEVTFRFAAQRHQTGLTIGDITGVAVGAWEYMWIEYESNQAAPGGPLSNIPKAVHVERVYDEADFSLIGIG